MTINPANSGRIMSRHKLQWLANRGTRRDEPLEIWLDERRFVRHVCFLGPVEPANTGKLEGTKIESGVVPLVTERILSEHHHNAPTNARLVRFESQGATTLELRLCGDAAPKECHVFSVDRLLYVVGHDDRLLGFQYTLNTAERTLVFGGFSPHRGHRPVVRRASWVADGGSATLRAYRNQAMKQRGAFLRACVWMGVLSVAVFILTGVVCHLILAPHVAGVARSTAFGVYGAGFLVALVTVLLAWPWVAQAVANREHARRLAPDECVWCRYSMEGGVTEACPECGRTSLL
ncbi:MAG: hypothetical protein AAGI53_16735 [Planctomycetota bacterium]